MPFVAVEIGFGMSAEKAPLLGTGHDLAVLLVVVAVAVPDLGEPSVDDGDMLSTGCALPKG